MLILFSFLFLDLLFPAAFAAQPVPQSTVRPWARAVKPTRSLSSVKTIPVKAVQVRRRPSHYLTVRPSRKLLKVKITPARIAALEKRSTGPTSFRVSQSGKLLFVQFESTNPNLQLSLKDSLIIQVFAHPPLQVTPTVITRSDFQKNPAGVPLNIAWWRGRFPASTSELFGKAAYTYCNRRTRQCKKTVTPLQLTVAR